MKINLRSLMLNAWKIYRKSGCTFSEALKRAWITAKAADENARRVEKAKATAGIVEEVRSWYGWTRVGREVIHEAKALFKVKLIDGSTKSGERIKAYFGLSQTQELASVTV